MARFLLGSLIVLLVSPVAAPDAVGADFETALGVGVTGSPTYEGAGGSIDWTVGYHVSARASLGIELFLFDPSVTSGLAANPNAYVKLSLLPKRVFDPYFRLGAGVTKFHSERFSIVMAVGLQVGAKSIGLFGEYSRRSDRLDGVVDVPFRDSAGIESLTVGIRVQHLSVME